jgi:hypothetical protein
LRLDGEQGLYTGHFRARLEAVLSLRDTSGIVEQVPGFAKFFHAAFAVGNVGVERHVSPLWVELGSRDDVPKLTGNDVNGEKIEIGWFVAYARRTVGKWANIRSFVVDSRGAHLDAGREAVADDEVEAGGIAIGLGHGEPGLGGAEKKPKLGEFATALGLAEGRGS